MSTTIHFTTVEKFKDKIKVLVTSHDLKLDNSETTELRRRLSESYNEIEGALLARGISAVEISTWARGEEFQLDIATYWYCRSKGWGAKNTDEQDWVKPFDRRAELQTVAIVSNDSILLAGSKNAVALGMDLRDINRNKGRGFQY